MRFEDIPGKSKIKQKLIQSVKDGRISHAQFFIGMEGCGSLAMALAYSTFVLCENKQETDSCGECQACRKSGRYIHPDVHFSFPFIRHASAKEKTSSNDYLPQWREFLDQQVWGNTYDWLQFINAENKQGNIPVTECKRLIHQLSLKSYESEFKVMIMWMPEMLGKEGNVLLKLIEEPPPKTLILFAGHDEDKVLNTILSRTQQVRLEPFTTEEISNHLISNGICPSETAGSTARLSEGNLREAINMAKQAEEPYFELFKSWLSACMKNKGIEMNSLTSKLAGMGRENQKNFFLYYLDYLRETMLIKMLDQHESKLDPEEKEAAVKLANYMSLIQIETLQKLVTKAHYSIERNANPKILFLNLSIQIQKVFRKPRVIN